MLVREAPWSWATFLLVLAAAAAGCEELKDEEEGTVNETEIPLERRGEIPLRSGFIDGKSVQYYRMGLFVPNETSWFPGYEKFPGMPVREMYVWPEADDSPSFEGAQRPIVDTLPRQAQSSDFFEVVLVRGATSAPNAIKSRATLLRSGFTLERTGQVVNCPLVGALGSYGKAAWPGWPGPAAKLRKIPLWYRKKTVHCLLVEGAGDAARPKVFTTEIAGGRWELRVAASDVYSLRSTAFTGADLVSGIPVPDNDIFRYAPGSPEYTPVVKVWDVTVPSDYQVGQLKSYADLFPVPGFTDPRIVARNPETFCNCPIVSTGK